MDKIEIFYRHDLICVMQYKQNVIKTKTFDVENVTDNQTDGSGSAQQGIMNIPLMVR